MFLKIGLDRILFNWTILAQKGEGGGEGGYGIMIREGGKSAENS